MKRRRSILTAIAVLFLAAIALSAQTKTNRPSKPPAITAQTAGSQPVPAETPSTKRNERPTSGAAAADTPEPNLQPRKYSYKFEREGFSYNELRIEHDERGKGTISLMKPGLDEAVVDPVNLSPITMAKINAALDELRFLDTTDDYQHSRDFSHMGTITFSLTGDGRSRSTKFNWTDNKAAKALMDEYRRLTNEYTWRFEISIARENQKLQTPGLMELIDSQVRRGEISDPRHLLPFLTELSTDERLPLMARNRALKLIKEIDKK